VSYSNIISVDFECNINILSPTLPITLDVFHNDEVIYNTITTCASTCLKYKTNNIGSHTFSYVLSGKTDQHTVLNNQNKFVSSAIVNIHNIQLNGIHIDNYVQQISNYKHDRNGYGKLKTRLFDGNIAYNGRVDIILNYPLYDLLLTLC